ncbi:NuA4 histone H4 acetyltransferase complex and the SWR1 complex subunit [Agyrium rufum]|nr:NuA4 histone H4 acetyltransferase complex and the SWR1 complex subunit [Agyrium rufum]
MPAPAGTKRVKGVSIYRPFTYGSVAKLIDPKNRPLNISPDHTHQWTVWVRGVDGEDISYWLKKVQFKLHETYSQSLRTIEAPEQFEVTETGWGEFEVTMKLWFVNEAAEKPQSIYHNLKLHPYGPDAERQRENKEPIISQQYDEVVFNEPVENFYEILTTGGPPSSRGKGPSKGSKQASLKKGNERTAELPYAEGSDNPFSQRSEAKELDRLGVARKQVEQFLKEERVKLQQREEVLVDLKKETGVSSKAR